MAKKVKDSERKNKPGAGPPLRNTNASKFNTPTQRQEVFKLFCAHMAAGYSAKTFHKPCVENTVYKLIRDYPQEFDDEILQMAKAEGCFVWESMGKVGAMGKLPNFNQSAWWRNMQNKLGWKDKVEHGGDAENPVVVIQRFAPQDDEGKKKK